MSPAAAVRLLIACVKWVCRPSTRWERGRSWSRRWAVVLRGWDGGW